MKLRVGDRYICSGNDFRTNKIKIAGPIMRPCSVRAKTYWRLIATRLNILVEGHHGL